MATYRLSKEEPQRVNTPSTKRKPLLFVSRARKTQTQTYTIPKAIAHQNTRSVRIYHIPLKEKKQKVDMDRARREEGRAENM